MASERGTSGGVEPGSFHRLGIAIGPGQDDPAPWLERVLGAQVQESRLEPGDVHTTTKVRVGSTDLAVFAAPGPTGTIGRFVQRYGPGLHSLAWHVDDLWLTEHILLDRGITITGTNVAARHFFMHPRDTFGILVEWTDHQPAPFPSPDGPSLHVAYITAAVRELADSVEFFQTVCGGRKVEGLAAGSGSLEATVDLRIGDMVLRLVAPKSVRSRFWKFLEEGGRGLHSFAVQTDDLGLPAERGLRVEDEGETSVWTDPASTLGLRIEWVRR